MKSTLLMLCTLLAMAPLWAGDEVYLESDDSGLAALLVSGDKDVRGASVIQKIYQGDRLVADAEMIPYTFRGKHRIQQIQLDSPAVRRLPDGIYRMEVHLEGQYREDDSHFYKRYVMPLAIENGQPYQEALVEETLTHNAKRLPQIMDGIELEKAANDPDVYTSYPCYYVQTFFWNYTYAGNDDGIGTVHGKIRWPSSTCDFNDGPPNLRRVLVFGHGNGQDYMDHDYLMAHLAKNGFVTLSIENSGDDQDIRARMLLSYLNSLYKYWGYSERLTDEVVFAGHSRGGEAAIRAARYVADDVVFKEADYQTKAVIAIAPTDGGNTGAATREVITGAISPAFLALYESKDGDVIGAARDPWPTAPDRTVFATYDRAGSEFSSEGIVLAGTHLRKAMAYVRKGHHKSWLDDDACLDWVGGPTCTDHQNMAKAYFNAFMRWNVYNQTTYRGYFDGTLTPDSLVSMPFTTQFSDNPRRVVDNFEDGNAATNTIGGGVLTSAGIVVSGQDELLDLDPASPHQTRGMRIKWSTAAGTPYVRFFIPDNSPLFIGRLRDVRNFDVLSFRAGQNYLDAYNTEGQSKDFYVRLYTASGWSNYVSVGDYAVLDYPPSYVTSLYGTVPYGDYANSNLQTVRIPLSAFTNADLENVSYVYFYFNKPGHTQGSIQLDSVEFAN